MRRTHRCPSAFRARPGSARSRGSQLTPPSRASWTRRSPEAWTAWLAASVRLTSMHLAGYFTLTGCSHTGLCAVLKPPAAQHDDYPAVYAEDPDMYLAWHVHVKARRRCWDPNSYPKPHPHQAHPRCCRCARTHGTAVHGATRAERRMRRLHGYAHGYMHTPPAHARVHVHAHRYAQVNQRICICMCMFM